MKTFTLSLQRVRIRYNLKRARSVAELLPWLYLKGISNGDIQESLAELLSAKFTDGLMVFIFTGKGSYHPIC
ncbi:MAG: hypothetical protein ACJAWL_001462 [Motiliproteus sp.]|jgi:hypothetical protein